MWYPRHIIYTTNYRIPGLSFIILRTKIFLHKFLNTLKYFYLLVKNYLKFLYFKRVILVFLKKFLSFRFFSKAPMTRLILLLS